MSQPPSADSTNILFIPVGPRLIPPYIRSLCAIHPLTWSVWGCALIGRRQWRKKIRFVVFVFCEREFPLLLPFLHLPSLRPGHKSCLWSLYSNCAQIRGVNSIFLSWFSRPGLVSHSSSSSNHRRSGHWHRPNLPRLISICTVVNFGWAFSALLPGNPLIFSVLCELRNFSLLLFSSTPVSSAFVLSLSHFHSPSTSSSLEISSLFMLCLPRESDDAHILLLPRLVHFSNAEPLHLLLQRKDFEKRQKASRRLLIWWRWTER